MKKKYLFGFIDLNSKIMFHYIPLVGFVFLTYYFSVWLGLMDLIKVNPKLGWTLLFLLYYVVLNVGDNFVHRYIIHKD
jgi:hypothetical protein